MAATRHYHRPSFITVSQIEKEKDIFHSRFFNLIYICSLDHSLGVARSSNQFYTRLSRGGKEASRPSETIPWDVGRSRQRSFKDRASGERCLGSTPRSGGIRNYHREHLYEREYWPLRHFSVFFLPPFLPPLLLRFFHSVRWVSPWWKRISVAALSRACGERYRVLAARSPQCRKFKRMRLCSAFADAMLFFYGTNHLPVERGG